MYIVFEGKYFSLNRAVHSAMYALKLLHVYKCKSAFDAGVLAQSAQL